MSKDKPRIEIASPDEVAQYAPGSPVEEPGGATAEPAAESADPEAQPQDELTTLREQVADLQDKLLRAKAEAQNIARRARQEQADAVRYGCTELLKSLLAVVDDFERTLEAAATTDKVQPVIEGVQLVSDKLLKLLKDNAVEVIEAVGKSFDPTEHAAVTQQTSEGDDPGTVIQEVQRGYRYRDRVLRPAQVIVAKAPDKGP